MQETCTFFTYCLASIGLYPLSHADPITVTRASSIDLHASEQLYSWHPLSAAPQCQTRSTFITPRVCPCY